MQMVKIFVALYYYQSHKDGGSNPFLNSIEKWKGSVWPLLVNNQFVSYVFGHLFIRLLKHFSNCSSLKLIAIATPHTFEVILFLCESNRFKHHWHRDTEKSRKPRTRRKAILSKLRSNDEFYQETERAMTEKERSSHRKSHKKKEPKGLTGISKQVIVFGSSWE